MTQSNSGENKYYVHADIVHNCVQRENTSLSGLNMKLCSIVVFVCESRTFFLFVELCSDCLCSEIFHISRCHADYYVLSEGGALLSTVAGGNSYIYVTPTQYFCLWL